jgi:hypothetical protein
MIAASSVLAIVGCRSRTAVGVLIATRGKLDSANGRTRQVLQPASISAATIVSQFHDFGCSKVTKIINAPAAIKAIPHDLKRWTNRPKSAAISATPRRPSHPSQGPSIGLCWLSVASGCLRFGTSSGTE